MKYAILILLEYNRVNWNTPAKLPGMVRDLERSYHLATNIFNIPKENVYIVTDIDITNITHLEIMADKLTDIKFPCATLLINSVIDTVKTINTDCTNPEIFVYYSGHGTCVPHLNQQIPCMILINNSGRERRYLPNKELINIFYNRYKPVNGIITVPVITRTTTQTMFRTSYSYITENIRIRYNGEQKKSNASILFIYDACRSGNLSGLKYEYIDSKSLKSTHSEDIVLIGSVSISSTNNVEDSLSSSDGSPFTNQICIIFEKFSNIISNINILHTLLYENLNPLLKFSRPTICISENNMAIKLPIFVN